MVGSEQAGTFLVHLHEGVRAQLGLAMNTDQISVRAGLHLRSVLRYLLLLDDLPNNTHKLMVVDRQSRYRGVLQLRHLLTNRPEQRVKDAMDGEFPTLAVKRPSREFATRLEGLGLISAPVVDVEGRLLGRIRVDDVVDVIREESERSATSHVSLDEEDDRFAPVLTGARRRTVRPGVNLLIHKRAYQRTDDYDAEPDRTRTAGSPETDLRGGRQLLAAEERIALHRLDRYR